MSLPRPAKLFISSVVVIIVAASAYLYFHDEGSAANQSTTDAYITSDFTYVAPKVSGLIARVMVEDNQVVKKGELLALIDDRDYVVAKVSAQAELVRARASIEKLEAQIVQQASVVQQASATVAGSAAELNFAQSNAKRYASLSSDGSATVQERQQTDSALKVAMSNRDRVAAAREVAQNQIAILKAEKMQAEGDAAKAEAVLRGAELNLSYTRIVAPIDGIVGQRKVREGAYVGVGTSLLAVVPLQLAYVEANFRETQLGRIRTGQAVTIHVDMLPNETLRGRVDSVSPASGVSFSEIAPDNATGNFTKVVQRMPVKITFEPGQPAVKQLRMGMSVIPTVHVEQNAAEPAAS